MNGNQSVNARSSQHIVRQVCVCVCVCVLHAEPSAAGDKHISSQSEAQQPLYSSNLLGKDSVYTNFNSFLTNYPDFTFPSAAVHKWKFHHLNVKGFHLPAAQFNSVYLYSANSQHMSSQGTSQSQVHTFQVILTIEQCSQI
ncbi:hypothetical protein XENOCAPTIV_023073 [Xenoophorus captivus]|uniref:Uncharacterized protein n=1 Tax=Xenoophorus captivus TaxID=1517983 RepID=A0ABV0RSD6_9TELE